MRGRRTRAVDAAEGTGGQSNGIIGIGGTPHTAVELVRARGGSARAADEHDVISNLLLVGGLAHDDRAIGITDQHVLRPREASAECTLKASELRRPAPGRLLVHGARQGGRGGITEPRHCGPTGGMGNGASTLKRGWPTCGIGGTYTAHEGADV